MRQPIKHPAMIASCGHSETRYPRKAPPTKPLKITWAGLELIALAQFQPPGRHDHGVVKGLIRAGLLTEGRSGWFLTALADDVNSGKVPVQIIGLIPASWTHQTLRDRLTAWRKLGIMIISHSGGPK